MENFLSLNFKKFLILLLLKKQPYRMNTKSLFIQDPKFQKVQDNFLVAMYHHYTPQKEYQIFRTNIIKIIFMKVNIRVLQEQRT